MDPLLRGSPADAVAFSCGYATCTFNACCAILAVRGSPNWARSGLIDAEGPLEVVPPNRFPFDSRPAAATVDGSRIYRSGAQGDDMIPYVMATGRDTWQARSAPTTDPVELLDAGGVAVMSRWHDAVGVPELYELNVAQPT
jgi:hypothetical protein